MGELLPKVHLLFDTIQAFVLAMFAKRVKSRMRSNDNTDSSAALEKSNRAKPGWLFVLPWSLRLVAGGGVNEVVKSLIVEFRDGGVFSPQLLVSSEAPESGATAGPELIRPYRLNLWSPIHHKHPVRGLFSFVYRLPYRCWAVRRLIHRHNIEVINPQFPGLGCLLFLVLKWLHLFKGKIILSFHNSDVTNALGSTGLERRLWRLLLRHADRIILVSNSLAGDLLAIEPSVSDKLTTIYNGVDLGLFASLDGVEDPLPQHSGPTVISVASFLPIKGHDVLVRALSIVVKKIPNVRLVLVGHDGPVFKEIRPLIDKLSLGERVFLYKDISHEHIPAYLAQAQLFVLASHREGHPLAVIEAGAVGLPVVCTRAIGSIELISDKITGRMVDVGDEHALAEAMIDLLTHPQEAQRMARQFHDYIKSNLTWSRTYQGYLDVARDGSIQAPPAKGL
jgi:glycosyltransferase involved in cell wall biosynthesis